MAIASAQNVGDELPYYELPEASEKYTAGTVAARMVDALGFRFYWATFELGEKDLENRPNKDARNLLETVDHIMGLSETILNSTLMKANERGGEKPELTFGEKRKQTLLNLKQAADILRASDDISQFKIVFKGNRGDSSFPFWNQINGPIADAIWHCGQIATMRRSSGNPINPNVSHFTGTVRQ